jgi:hypothetical protein
MGGSVAGEEPKWWPFPSWAATNEFPHFQPESWPCARSSMKRGGGSGGGASGSLEPGMDMGRRDEREEDVEEIEREGEGRDREKEKSVTEVELESQMRIDGGEVAEGYSILRADIGGGG